MPTKDDKQRLKTMTKDMAWIIGLKPFKMLKTAYNAKKDKDGAWTAEEVDKMFIDVAYSKAERDAVMFPKDTYIHLYVARAPADEAKEGSSFDFVLLPAGTTFKGFYETVNNFYRLSRVKKTDPRFQSAEGKKLIGKTYLSNLGNHIFYEGDTEYLNIKHKGHDVISVFAFGS